MTRTIPLFLRLIVGASCIGVVTGCVVPYGERPPPIEAPRSQDVGVADLAAIDARILLLLQEGVSVDRARRLEHARAIILKARIWPPGPRKDLVEYLSKMLELEERLGTDSGARGVDIGARVVEETPPLGSVMGSTEEEPLTADGADEEDLEGTADSDTGTLDTAAPGDEEAAAASLDDLVAAIRDALAEERHGDALELSRGLGDAPADPDLARLKQEVEDDWVSAERERAGRIFLDSRSKPVLGRKAGYREVQVILAGLLDEFPESRFADPIRRNLETVERELAGME